MHFVLRFYTFEFTFDLGIVLQTPVVTMIYMCCSWPYLNDILDNRKVHQLQRTCIDLFNV